MAVLVLIVGFGFTSLANSIQSSIAGFAQRLGLQKIESPPDYYPYEHETAVCDALGAIPGIMRREVFEILGDHY